MRRPDSPDNGPPRETRRFGLPSAAALPREVYDDFVDMLFGMRLPIIGFSVVFVAIAGLIAYELHDAWIGALTLAMMVLTGARLATLAAYRRAKPVDDVADLRRWEQKYAVGIYLSAIAIGLLNLRALTYESPLIHLITVSLVFSFGAGMVARTSLRPVICVASLLLAAGPTIAALLALAVSPGTSAMHGELFAVEALLMAMVTALSLQSVAHLYRSAVEHHTARHDLARMAKHDALTGLPNRLLLRERFQATGRDAAGRRSRMAVHFIDLDGFKAINDTRGHPAGDVVLQHVARRLEGMVRSEDTVARLGGDEFVVLQPDVAEDSEIEMLARRIIKRLSAPYEFEGVQMRISASVGIALIPDQGSDLEELLACADAALYHSKMSGKSRLSFSARDDSVAGQLVA